jgi:hypothetical protein
MDVVVMTAIWRQATRLLEDVGIGLQELHQNGPRVSDGTGSHARAVHTTLVM